MSERDLVNYFGGLVRRKAETRDAIVESVASGLYTLTDIATGGTLYARALSSATFAVGKRVTVRHDTRTAGRPPVIVGASTDTGNGAIVGALSSEASGTPAEVTQLPTLPVRLTAGGLSVGVTLYGRNLTSATYGHASITDDVAQVAGESGLVLKPKASGACPKGLYTLTVAGSVIPDFFEVI